MSTPIKVTLPLADVLKAKPELWLNIAKALEHMGMRVPFQEFPVDSQENGQWEKVRCEPVPINKVGDYCEGEDENTTLPAKLNEVKSLAIWIAEWE